MDSATRTTADTGTEEQERLEQIHRQFNQDQDTVEETPSVDDYTDNTLLTTRILNRLGFTRTAIAKFLTPEPEPQLLGVEPRGNTVSPERFYSVEEVKRALADPAVKEWLLKSKERRAKMEKVKQENIRLALGQEITIEPVSLTTALQATMKSYNDANEQDISAGKKTPLNLDGTDPMMIGRVNHNAVQVIRHQFTNYDVVWSQFDKKPGFRDTWEIIALKTSIVIKQTYPQLARYVDADAIQKTQQGERRREREQATEYYAEKRKQQRQAEQRKKQAQAKKKKNKRKQLSS